MAFISEADAAKLGIGGKAKGRKKAKCRRIPSLPGPPSLALLTEHKLQAQVVAHFRRALVSGSKVRAIPNQRTIGHLPEEAQAKVLRSLAAEGLDDEALDLEFIWDPALGDPDNRGVCWIEMKRPVKPHPVSPGQDRFIADARAMGFVAGIAQSLEQVESLLTEAGAPLRIRILQPVPAAKMSEAPAVGPAGASVVRKATTSHAYSPNRSTRQET